MCVLCWAVAASRWSQHPLPFPQSWRKATEEKKENTLSAAVPLPHALSAADSCRGTGHTSSAVRPLSGDCRRSRFAHRNSKVCHHLGKAEWWWWQNCRTDPLYCRCTKLRWTWSTSLSLQIAKQPATCSTSSCVDQCLCNAMYSGYNWLAYFSGRHLFFVTKTLFHEFVRHFNRFPHWNSRVARHQVTFVMPWLSLADAFFYYYYYYILFIQ